MLATDGIFEHVSPQFITTTINDYLYELDSAAELIAEQALANGSNDNLTLQIIRVTSVAKRNISVVQHQLDTLPFPPQLTVGAEFDGFRIIRQLHASARSHVYLALDICSGNKVVLKTPSTDLGSNPEYLERFLTEEWIAKRISSEHVVRAAPIERPRNFLYTVSEFIDGQTLTQWLNDNPQPNLETVRGIIEQVAKGQRAFHRMDMLHQDLKPDNLMIDNHGIVKIIDFGSTYVAGLNENIPLAEQNHLQGTALFAAPEYFLGLPGTERSELFSLAVLTYSLLSGRYPYGTKVAGARTLMAQRRLQYQSVLHADKEIPAWVDYALHKALQINPERRYEDSSEFIHDLRTPNEEFLQKARPPLLERNPVAFWQGVSLVLAATVIYLLST